MEEIKKTVFSKGYSNSNFISRYFYTYVIDTVNKVNKNGKFETEDILDININSCFDKTSEDKTEKAIKDF
jgi:hypothetical protein